METLISKYKEFSFRINKDIEELEIKNGAMSTDEKILYLNCFKTFDGFMMWLEDNN